MSTKLYVVRSRATGKVICSPTTLPIAEKIAETFGTVEEAPYCQHEYLYDEHLDYYSCTKCGAYISGFHYRSELGN